MLISNSIKLSIGEINIKIIPNSKKDVYLNEAYICFISIDNDKPHMVLNVLDNDPPNFKNKEKIFTSDLMDYYRDGEKDIISFSLSENDDPFPFKMMVLDHHHKIANLYTDFNDHTNSIEYRNYLQRPLLEILFGNLIMRHSKGVMIHGCCVKKNGYGMLFIGQSGAGKTTIANLWKNNSDVTILSDECLIIKKNKDQFWAYGTPWHGENLFSQDKCSIKKIFFIEHAKENFLDRKNALMAVVSFFGESRHQLWGKSTMQLTMDFLAELSKKIPCYRLGFIPNKSIIEFIKNIQDDE
jgi:hypothetical protein